jgi:hypothetical protein
MICDVKVSGGDGDGLLCVRLTLLVHTFGVVFYIVSSWQYNLLLLALTSSRDVKLENGKSQYCTFQTDSGRTAYDIAWYHMSFYFSWMSYSFSANIVVAIFKSNI